VRPSDFTASECHWAWKFLELPGEPPGGEFRGERRKKERRGGRRGEKKKEERAVL
jgi:hypothetical protein